MLNKVILIGRLTSRPELRYTGSNKAYSRICVAVSRYNGETDFINVVTWDKQAENICNYLDKGSLVSIEGRLQISSYEDSEGNNRNITDVIAQNVKFLDRKSSTENQNKEYETNDEEYNDDYEDFGNSISDDDNLLD